MSVLTLVLTLRLVTDLVVAWVVPLKVLAARLPLFWAAMDEEGLGVAGAPGVRVTGRTTPGRAAAGVDSRAISRAAPASTENVMRARMIPKTNNNSYFSSASAKWFNC
jgi:hypothetical protein